MFAILPNHGRSEKLVKGAQTRWMGRGACPVYESSVEILISPSVFRVQHRGIAKMHLITQCLRYSQITAVHKCWSKELKLAGWVGKHGWCMNQVSKSLYRHPFFTHSAFALRKCTLFRNSTNVAESGKLEKLLTMRKQPFREKGKN